MGRSSYWLGQVPSHGPYCYKVKAYPTKCPTCRAEVVYFECTCGSKVFLGMNRSGPHVCGMSSAEVTKLNGGRRSRGFLPEGPVTCPFCLEPQSHADYARHVSECRKGKFRG